MRSNIVLMRKRAVIIGIGILLGASATFAGDAELRDVAQQNGCPVKKITLLRQKVGPDGNLTYKVDCNLPKAAEQKDSTPPSITIICRLNLCQTVR